MWLVDTSVWVDHFRHGRGDLTDRLLGGLVLSHPWVSGELSCGNLKERQRVLAYLSALPFAKIATDSEVAHLIEDRRLWGRGLGWIDIHLLASALLTGCQLWTLDKKLEEAAQELKLC